MSSYSLVIFYIKVILLFIITIQVIVLIMISLYFNKTIYDLQYQINNLNKDISNIYSIFIFVSVTVMMCLGLFINKLERKINRISNMLSITDF